MYSSFRNKSCCRAVLQFNFDIHKSWKLKTLLHFSPCGLKTYSLRYYWLFSTSLIMHVLCRLLHVWKQTNISQVFICYVCKLTAQCHFWRWISSSEFILFAHQHVFLWCMRKFAHTHLFFYRGGDFPFDLYYFYTELMLFFIP